ncbi:MAG: hypothetical protein DI551_00780 [Micavibrio aeruginosavorus]|uniref:Uncharacterized protein n=1 Tax=Micavibrio aeruginosavorus TaxID=349221 RepID=A0A2W5N8N2_9BACT|nr:MAG: hypothetical protein DI551_00780 [Micavibrio aeruginosavorus]
MALIFGSIFFGALCGWYRGGPLHNRDEIVGRIDPSWLRKTVDFIVQGDFVNAIAFGIFCAFVSDGPAFAVFLWEVAMMYRGATPGWGDYIGAAKGTRLGLHALPDGADLNLQTSEKFNLYKPLKEVAYIDKIIEKLLPHPRLWGIAGLSIRCGEWGLFIGAPFLNFLVPAAGLLAGPIVYLLSKILPDKYVWPCFEAIISALFWLAIAIGGNA